MKESEDNESEGNLKENLGKEVDVVLACDTKRREFCESLGRRARRMEVERRRRRRRSERRNIWLGRVMNDIREKCGGGSVRTSYIH